MSVAPQRRPSKLNSVKERAGRDADPRIPPQPGINTWRALSGLIDYVITNAVSRFGRHAEIVVFETPNCVYRWCGNFASISRRAGA